MKHSNLNNYYYPQAINDNPVVNEPSSEQKELKCATWFTSWQCGGLLALIGVIGMIWSGRTLVLIVICCLVAILPFIPHYEIYVDDERQAKAEKK